MRALYLTHNGLTEPLGQSQVLPYLEGLARAGADIDVLSFEPEDATTASLDVVRERAAASGLRWRHLRRSSRHDTLTKAREAATVMRLASGVALARRPEIVHTRSYVFLPVIDAIATALPRARMLFDCRGLMADEYVDIGYWREGELRVRLTRAYERRALKRADGLVFLTHRIHQVLRERGRVPARTPVEVVPCCVDTARFVPDDAARAATRAEIGAGGLPVVVYSGSLSGWYLQEEMAAFVGALRRRIGPLRFLVLTRSPSDVLVKAAAAAGVPAEEIVVRKMPPEAMPRMLAGGDLGLSFIKPCFSKLASSPTKVAEYLAVGMPVVVNSGIGDQDELGADPRVGVVLEGLDAATLERGAERAAEALRTPRPERVALARAASVRDYDATEVGVARYVRLYERLAG